MISTALPARTQVVQRSRRPIVAATAVALGAGILSAPSANAADKWGPVYLMADSTSKPDSSHTGAYGPPGQALPGVTGLAYRADPELDGPESAGSYGPAKEFTSWTSKATGKQASAQDVARAAYVLSKWGSSGTC
ncbi:hypothetical protein [Streptomyces sp. 8N706]|uniref:hypothetical protein n=1 Tax=Streptomyces sp. 8N706 TaxID=3457416 RepID=UPI003FCF33A6